MAAGLLASCNEGTNTQQAKSDNTVDSLIGVINQKDNELNDILSTIVGLAGFALSLIGIINVANKEDKDLPFIGTIRMIKD